MFKEVIKMKKIICIAAAALLLGISCAACGNSEKDVSARESMASEAKSRVGEAAEDFGEAVTDAVSVITSEADRMYDNGQISDGDGVIGNEPTD